MQHLDKMPQPFDHGLRQCVGCCFPMDMESSDRHRWSVLHLKHNELNRIHFVIQEELRVRRTAGAT